MTRAALWGAVALALAAFAGGPAMAQTGVWTASIGTVPALGNVAIPASGTTTYRFTPAGVVSVVSGTAVRTSTNAVQGVVTITCTGTGNNCNAGVTGKVKIGSINTPTGKAGALTNFTVSSAATITGLSGTNPINFTIALTTKNQPVTVNIGADFPITAIDAAGSTGAATSGFYVYAINTGTPVAGASGNATATVRRPISFTGTPTLVFGTIYKPTTGSSVVTLNPSLGSNPLSATGDAIIVGATAARASYSITGEGAQAITVTPATSFVMNRVGGGTTPITVTLTTTTLPTALSGSLGSAGTAGFYMGGNFTLTTATQMGTYQGSYNVTVAYN